MKQIPYVVKQTAARTEYRKLSDDDKNWVLDECQRVLNLAKDCALANFPSTIQATNILNQKNPNMPRMGNGQRNSAVSMCEGILSNFNNGQYDLSDKTCKGVSEVMRIAVEIFGDECEELEFIQVASLPLHTVSTVKDDEPALQGSFADLFDIETITVTYKRK